jgi:transposase
VAVAAHRSPKLTEVYAEDHPAVMKISAKRYWDLGSHRTRVPCRLHAVLCELIPGGPSGEIYASRATKMLDELEVTGAVAAARHELARELLADLVGLDEQRHAAKERIAAAVAASKTTVTEIYGVGPIVAAISSVTSGTSHDSRPGTDSLPTTAQPRSKCHRVPARSTACLDAATAA